MAPLRNWLGPLTRRLQNRLPDSLFGRLALLLITVAVVSHVLALSLMVKFRPEPAGMRPPAPAQQAQMQPPPPHEMPLGGMVLDISVRLGAVLLAAWVGARWLSAPMHRLAQATRALANNIHSPPITPQGTRECREATGTINQLQAHIRTQLEERDLFVAAVSHDLRTPLTRLALRVETLDNAHDRQRLAKDIAEMDQMIRSTLDYLRGAADAEPWVEMDLRSLVHSQVHDRQDCGEPLALTVSETARSAPLQIKAQVSAVRRCIANVLDNAVRYGGSAEVELKEQGALICVCVSDRGPGIPADALDKVLMPFYRVESSRNRHTGGVGLGLATAHDIAKRHGGSLKLGNRPEGGLQVDLHFPATT